jgi:hypothetical protein
MGFSEYDVCWGCDHVGCGNCRISWRFTEHALGS